MTYLGVMAFAYGNVAQKMPVILVNKVVDEERIIGKRGLKKSTRTLRRSQTPTNYMMHYLEVLTRAGICSVVERAKLVKFLKNVNC
jgi:hypothetical protein